MTPDDRATALVRELVEDLGLADRWPEAERPHLIACMARRVAGAIREAREGALEEAAQAAGEADDDYRVEAIRALKSE